MQFRTIEQIVRDAAGDIQARVGGNYQTTNLRRYAQEEMEGIWDEYDARETLDVDTLTLAAGVNAIVLPRRYAKLVGQYGAPLSDSNIYWPLWWDQSAAIAKLQEIYRGGPSGLFGPVDGGAYNAAFMGYQPVIQQPDVAMEAAGETAVIEKLKLVSTASADVSLYVRITGEDADRNFIYDSIATNASNGTTAVETTNTYARITSISTGAVGTGGKTGRFVVTGSTSLAEYNTMEPWASATKYAAYQLAVAPTTSTTLYYVGKKNYVPFLDLIDAPPIPGVDAALKWGICARAMLEKRDADLAMFYGRMRQAAMAKVRTASKEPAKMRLRRG